MTNTNTCSSNVTVFADITFFFLRAMCPSLASATAFLGKCPGLDLSSFIIFKMMKDITHIPFDGFTPAHTLEEFHILMFAMMCSYAQVHKLRCCVCGEGGGEVGYGAISSKAMERSVN